MLSGFATPAATGALAAATSQLSYTDLARTGLMVSQAGFGGYRIADSSQAHAQALTKALLAGINVIDTSANYTDGESEKLIGRVLRTLVAADRIAREQVFVVSKVGYLQGQNYRLSQQRQQEGRPFKELVPYGQELEHCIHPEFIEDQLTRSLERLDLETIDGYLLHNPEYYLSWADHQQLQNPHKEYYRRIQAAFSHLEDEVHRGRIRYYGISSNTFPAAGDDPEFTHLKTVWDIASEMSPEHHFRLIQLPLNLLEPNAVLGKNQSTGQSVLQLAAEKDLGVLINRPLNAFYGNRLVRLADIEKRAREDYDVILKKMKNLTKSETVLWRHILPAMDDIPAGLKVRIKQQVGISDTLKHYWRNFGSYERWREVKSGMILPRVQGVMDFLRAYQDKHPRLAAWMAAHMDCLETALEAVGSIYAEEAARTSRQIRQMVANVDPDWAAEGTLSQKALRAVRSTAGVTSVLVGMRREAYVDDVLVELNRPVRALARADAWSQLHRRTASVMKG
jgi:aryl-alcohol dehydrogenase-like predicted oxidoreductase